jgi:hypothetical protein
MAVDLILDILPFPNYVLDEVLPKVLSIGRPVLLFEEVRVLFPFLVPLSDGVVSYVCQTSQNINSAMFVIYFYNF